MSSIQRVCSVENCNNIVTSRTWCNPHYQRWYRYKDPIGSRDAKTHGMSSTPEYRTWAAVKMRCHNPNTENYPRYGGRGIKMCAEWFNSFQNFYTDMGSKPTSKHQIDRIDNTRGYEPGNCRWVLPQVQAWNTKMKASNTTGFRGLKRSGNRWVACIRIYYGQVNEEFRVGSYATKEEAAIAYDLAAIFFRGNEAKTNIL